MTSHERFDRMFAHREADRVPIIDIPWASTIERWHREGMPAGMDFVDYFDLDRVGRIHVSNSPLFEERVVEETPEYTIRTTRWGATLKNWSHAASTPEFLDFKIADRESWKAAKSRIVPSPDRIPWAQLERDYPAWKAQGRWIEAGLFFGFDVTHSWVIGTERLLMAMVEAPDWCREIFAHQLETHLALLELVWEAGYRFDAVSWPDDMGYKGTQFFSLDMYRDLLKPFHKRAIDWAHARGIRAHLHSCGNINPFVPELIEIGLDGLNPLEVKAGMDPVHMKQTHGDRLLLHGGVDAVLWDQPDRIEAEIERVLPVLKQGGGYIFSSDHSVPSSVSLADFKRIVDCAKRVGAY